MTRGIRAESELRRGVQPEAAVLSRQRQASVPCGGRPRYRTQILHDLHYNAALLEIALEQGPTPPHDNKEAPR